ncbi:MAG TPA: polysaccharide biosynthesis/export family protein [Verrucomicrobiae bacterium]|jgi:polysaccharide export outer membrane protein|nr:polysaccharide biosynthesis/export family protein [Verrucomicrobiae bacterium]
MRLRHKHFGQVLLAVLSAAMLCLTGCLTDKNSSPSAPPVAEGTNDSAAAMLIEPISAGDRLSIDLNANTPTPIPSLQTDVKSDGTISLPDIGRVEAAGKTPGQLEVDIQNKFVPNFYRHMNVTVTPLVRFYYVRGEVNLGSTGGKQLYTGPLTVTQAIGSAGDFNPFAKKWGVQLTRRFSGKTYIVDCVKALSHPELDLPVYPGDTIFVPRRFW